MPRWPWLAELTWLIVTSITAGALMALIHGGGGISQAVVVSVGGFVILLAVRVVRLLWRRSADRSVNPS